MTDPPVRGFWLGTHEPHWMARFDVPFFVSRVRLKRYRRIPKARMWWAMDSGGFSELDPRRGELPKRWTITEEEYVDDVRRYSEEIGNLAWAAPMDWMCEPWVVDGTGLTLDEHQGRTVDNLCRLRQLAPELRIIPVLQGWTVDDYLRCAERYLASGIDPSAEPLVGVGSVCRRQADKEGEDIFRTLGALYSVHGFGVKLTGLARYGKYLASADSMAWSYNARRNPSLEGCTHRSCTNCPRRALWWRDKALAMWGPMRANMVPGLTGD